MSVTDHPAEDIRREMKSYSIFACLLLIGGLLTTTIGTGIFFGPAILADFHDPVYAIDGIAGQASFIGLFLFAWLLGLPFIALISALLMGVHMVMRRRAIGSGRRTIILSAAAATFGTASFFGLLLMIGFLRDIEPDHWVIGPLYLPAIAFASNAVCAWFAASFATWVLERRVAEVIAPTSGAGPA